MNSSKFDQEVNAFVKNVKTKNLRKNDSLQTKEDDQTVIHKSVRVAYGSGSLTKDSMGFHNAGRNHSWWLHS